MLSCLTPFAATIERHARRSSSFPVRPTFATPGTFPLSRRAMRFAIAEVLAALAE
jgi:hypothetical protein